MVYLIYINQHIVPLVHILLKKYSSSKWKKKRNICLASSDSQEKTIILDTTFEHYVKFLLLTLHLSSISQICFLGNSFTLYSKVKIDVISYNIPSFLFFLLLWLPHQLLCLVGLFHIHSWVQSLSLTYVILFFIQLISLNF